MGLIESFDVVVPFSMVLSSVDCFRLGEGLVRYGGLLLLVATRSVGKEGSVTGHAPGQAGRLVVIANDKLAMMCEKGRLDQIRTQSFLSMY